MSEYLIDLDELVLRCKDKKAREYIAEAVACYKVGAFRACIVTTWIAVVYDFVDKLRQLELTGDKNAIKKLGEFESARNSEDHKAALEFEREVLDWAQVDFEFISPIERDDLDRLMKDRNRCAHPSMTSSEEIYQPTAELARYHLRNAITHLLQHQPVQGKAALDRLVNEVLSDYFPVETSRAVEYFYHGPLDNPKLVLVRNFILILIKNLLIQDYDNAKHQRFIAALNAVRQIHYKEAEKNLEMELSKIAQKVSDQELNRIIRFLKEIKDTWQYLAGDIHIKLKNYIKGLQKEEILVLLSALDVPELKSMAIQRLQATDEGELSTLIKEHPRSEFADKAIEFYGKASSFFRANTMSNNLITPLIPVMNERHFEQIFASAIPPYGRLKNQIAYSSDFKNKVLPQIKCLLPEQVFRDLVALLREAHPSRDIWEDIFPEDYPDEEQE